MGRRFTQIHADGNRKIGVNQRLSVFKSLTRMWRSNNMQTQRVCPLLLVILVVGLTTVACQRANAIQTTLQATPQATKQPPEEQRPTETPVSYSAVVNFTILQEQGGRIGWLHSQDLLAFDSAGEDGYADVYTSHLDGSDLHCLTCDREDVPQLHNGNPAWHSSGEYLVFQAQDPDLGLPSGAWTNFVTSPGIAINNNLWLMTADNAQFWQLTQVEERHGTLHPHFSPAGTNLLWSEMIGSSPNRIGCWAIRLADFSVEDGEPRLTNIQTLEPNDLQLYEMHGFSPDGQVILFSGVEEGKYYYDMEIYTMELDTGQVNRLTENDEWDEHAHFTPDGRHIVWVSSEDTPQPKGTSWAHIVRNPPKFEYWIMRADGSDKRRLSGFNHPTAPEYWPVTGGVGLGDFDFGPDGETIAAKMRCGHGQELLVLIEFDFQAEARSGD
jgi:hypothetical protein